MKDGLNFEGLYKDGVPQFTKDILDQIDKLSDIVVNRHYAKMNAIDKEEMKSLAVLKAIKLIKEGSFDCSKSSIKNYLYTGMRNEMSNFIYSKRKEV